MINAIKNNDLFSKVNTDILYKVINSYSEVICFKKYDIVFSKSNFKKSLGIVINGRLKVCKGKMLMSKLNVGDVFGTVTLYSAQDYFTTDIISTNESKILFISKDGIDFLIKNDFNFAENFISYLSNRIYFLTGRLESLTAGNVEQNLLKYIIENADYSGEKPTLFVKNYSELALKIDSGRASLYRALDHLSEMGYIIKKDKIITLERTDLS